MNNENDGQYRPSTSRGELSDNKSLERPSVSSRLNNNVVNGFDDSVCAHCDTDDEHVLMSAASSMHFAQEDHDSDDDCLYTYRGDRQEPAINNLPVANRSTSPLMDYLEMDFDPETTVGNESEAEDVIVPNPTKNDNDGLINSEEPIPSCSGVNFDKQKEEISPKKNEINTHELIPKLSVTNLNLPSPQYNGCTDFKEEHSGCIRRNADTMEMCQKMKRMRVDDLNWVKEMIWSESDAAQFQVNQIGVSACGATSVVNALLALGIPVDIDHIVNTIGTSLRDENAPLIPYLESRAKAGCMAQDLVRTLEITTDSLVSARFFATHHNMDISIAPWLASWIKKGAVPILTLNRQRAAVSDSLVPDSWHHQMMYGVAYNPLRPESAQMYLTNPLSQPSMDTLHPQLISPSTLMIRRADVLSRCNSQTDLYLLATHSRLWYRFNVLGQVANLLREEHENIQYTNHIVIPACYKSGITLAIKTSSNYSHELKSVPEL